VSDQKNYRTVLSILLVAVALVSLSNIPLLYGYLKQSPGGKFMGIMAGIRDSNYYFMMMVQTDGWWPVLKNYFATGEPDAIYHGLFWFLLGRIGRILGIKNLVAFQGTRIVATAVFVPVSYWFASKFLKSRAERIAAMIMLALSAGAGWIMMISYRSSGGVPFIPADIGNPEVSSFFTLMTFPHLATALILVALCFGLFYASVSERKLWMAGIAGTCGLFLGFIHAINLVVIYAVLGVFALVSLVLLKEKGPMRSALMFGAISVWSIAYYLYLMLSNPLLLPQAPVRSPTPLAYVVGFAPFLVLGAVRVAVLIKNRTLPREDLFLICWVVSIFPLLYSYSLLSQEARAVLGLQVPLILLSVRAIFGTLVPWAAPDWERSDRRLLRVRGLTVVAIIILFTFPSTVYNIFERVSRLRSHPEAFALRLDDYDALCYLRDEDGEGVVLSSERIGSYVPRLARKRSWLGQYDLPSHDSRFDMAMKFFLEETPPSARHDFMKKNDIEFVYYGRYERELDGFDPGKTPFLERIFHNNSVAIYRFVLKEASG